MLESEWTDPREECPHPERWHATDDQSTEDEVTELIAAYVRALQPDYVIETGTCQANTTIAIATALQKNGQGHLDSIEVDPQLARMAERNCQGLPVAIHNMSSLAFTPRQQIQFAFFDSLTPLRADEFRRYYKWMSNRTVVGFHDTGPQHPTRPLIDNLVDSRQLEPPLYLPTPRGICFARVRR